MKLKSLKRIEPKPARCISVDAPDRLFAAGGSTGNALLTHNSVIQRNIVFGCILRPDNWRFLGIDLKRVELSHLRAYSNVVLGIATELEDALTVLRFAQATMMKRYNEMEAAGFTDFMDTPGHGPALMVMIDEAGELLSPAGVRALAASTPVQTPNGLVPISELKLGDSVFDPNWEIAKVERKYTPVEQSRFELKVRQDSTATTESYVAGSEHYWVAYFEHPDGTIEGPETVDTSYLYEYKQHQDTLPPESRTQVKFKRLAKSLEVVTGSC